MSIENTNVSTTDDGPVRRRGDRRVTEENVPNERRKGDRRDIPGLGALIRTLFRRGAGKDS